MNRTLEPKSLKDILIETFTIYKNNFLRLIAIVAIVQVPMVALSIIVSPLMPAYGELVTEATSPFTSIFWIPIYLVFFAASIWMGGAIIHAVSEQYFKQPINIGRAYSFAWQRMGAMFGAVVLVYLAMAGIFLAAILIGVIIAVAIGGSYSWLIGCVIAAVLTFAVAPAAIYLGTNWVFILPTAMFEGYGPKAALAHSSALVKQNWWRVLGIVMLLLIIVQIIAMIFYTPAMIGAVTWTITGDITGAITETTTGLPTGLTGLMILAMAGGAIGSIISVPIGMIGITLLYFDLRVRKHGYNFNDLANELGLTSTSTATTASPTE
jgi:hypothetical protein